MLLQGKISPVAPLPVTNNFSTGKEGEHGQTHGTLTAPLRDMQGPLPAPSEQRMVGEAVPGSNCQYCFEHV